MAAEERYRDLRAQLALMAELYEGMQPQEILADAFQQEPFSNAAVVSSFGAESAVLLHMVAQIRPNTPILLIDTGKLFDETLRYRDRLQHTLGLEDVRCISPRQSEVRSMDPDGTLHRHNPDACCNLRKTAVLHRALAPFDAWINGRKRYQSDQRNLMSIVEFDDGRAKLNPLANWDASGIRAYLIDNALPEHPLFAKGYLSVGCSPCTSKIRPGENPRAGRWKGLEKTECGIHRSPYLCGGGGGRKPGDF